MHYHVVGCMLHLPCGLRTTFVFASSHYEDA
jgi:hypothetical protein